MSAGVVSAHQGHVSCQPWAIGDVAPTAQTGTLGTIVSAGAKSGPNAISNALAAEHVAFCQPTP